MNAREKFYRDFSRYLNIAGFLTFIPWAFWGFQLIHLLMILIALVYADVWSLRADLIHLQKKEE